MELTAVAYKIKKYSLNLTILFISLIIMSKIYFQHIKESQSLKEQKNIEIKTSELLKEIKQKQDNLASYKNLLNRKDVSSIIGIISELAAKSQVEVVSLKPNLEKKEEEYIALPFDLALRSADYHALGEFLSKLESDRNVFMVENISISYDEAGDILQSSLRLNYYIFKEQ